MNKVNDCSLFNEYFSYLNLYIIYKKYIICINI